MLSLRIIFIWLLIANIMRSGINVGNSSLSYLYLSSKCRPFDNMPFNQSPSGHNPRQSALFECIPCYDRKPELFARFIRNNTVGKGQLFTDISELSNLS